jgi:pimeloyl-ACP methyl ester carboxylesterase/DNA-binding CsgD family transcriptional regulator
MSKPSQSNNGVSPATVLALVEALYVYAENPAHWDDIGAAIEAMPLPLDPSNDPVAATITNHALRAAAMIDRLNAGRPGHQAGQQQWDAVLLSSEGLVRSVVGHVGERLAPFLAKPIVAGSGLALHRGEGRPLELTIDPDAQSPEVSLSPFVLESADEKARCFGVMLPREAFPPSLSAAFGLGEVWAEPLTALVLLSAREVTAAGKVTNRNFGLTTAQSRLVAKLLQGLTISDAAQELGLTAATARWHLKNIFIKTGTRRQADLLRLLTDASEILQPASDTPAMLRPESPPRRFVTLEDGRRLFYREYGAASGVPVIYFHFGLSASMLPPAAARAVERNGVRVIAFERPGFGQSDPRKDYTFDAVAADVEELCRHLGLRRVTLFGDGYGGGFAVASARRMGTVIRRLALHAPHLGRTLSNSDYSTGMHILYRQPWFIPAAAEVLRRGLRISVIRSLMGYIAEKSRSDATRIADPEFNSYLSATIVEALERTSAGLAAELVMFGSDARQDPSDLTCPISVWHGEQNPSVPLTETKKHFASHKHATLHVLPATGLYLPQPVFEDIFGWLSEVPTRDRPNQSSTAATGIAAALRS